MVRTFLRYFATGSIDKIIDVSRSVTGTGEPFVAGFVIYQSFSGFLFRGVGVGVVEFRYFQTARFVIGSDHDYGFAVCLRPVTAGVDGGVERIQFRQHGFHIVIVRSRIDLAAFDYQQKAVFVVLGQLCQCRRRQRRQSVGTGCLYGAVFQQTVNLFGSGSVDLVESRAQSALGSGNFGFQRVHRVVGQTEQDVCVEIDQLSCYRLGIATVLGVGKECGRGGVGHGLCNYHTDFFARGLCKLRHGFQILAVLIRNTAVVSFYSRCHRGGGGCRIGGARRQRPGHYLADHGKTLHIQLVAAIDITCLDMLFAHAVADQQDNVFGAHFAVGIYA